MANLIPLSPSFLEGLRRLAIVARRRAGGVNAGERTTVRKGQGVEFADHRGYTPGDDPRFLDWSAYARIGRPVVKEFLEESDLALTVFVDASASMGFGTPRRLDVACTLASVFCRIALARHDRAGIGVIRGDQVQFLPPQRSQGQVLWIEEALAKAEAEGKTALATALARHFATTKAEGVVVVISDLYDPKTPLALVDCLVHHGVDARILMLSDDEELRLLPGGPVDIVDSETGETIRMLITPEVAQELARSIAAYRAKACAYAANKGIPCTVVDCHRPVPDIVTELVARGEVLHA